MKGSTTEKNDQSELARPALPVKLAANYSLDDLLSIV